jgi:uncharacterized protein YqhQ
MSENGAGPASGKEAAPKLRLGGMALRNGLLVHGPTSWAAAARGDDGRIEVASGSKPSFAQGRLGATPLLRGPLRLAEAFAVVPIARRRLPSARLPLEDPRVIFAAIATAGASAAIRKLRPATLAREAGLTLLGVIPAMAALRDHDLAAYHGVEHKAIGAYERGSPDPADVPKEHERCGSNLIGPLLLFSIAGQAAVERLVERPGSTSRAVAAVASVSASVEVFAYAERNPDSGLGRAVHRAGHEIQRVLSTREPSPDQLEVGALALDALLREEGVARSASTA